MAPTPNIFKQHKQHSKPGWLLLFYTINDDFYTGLHQDAEILNEIAGATITTYDKNGKKWKMAGIPAHLLENSMHAIKEKGLKIRIINII